MAYIHLNKESLSSWFQKYTHRSIIITQLKLYSMFNTNRICKVVFKNAPAAWGQTGLFCWCLLRLELWSFTGIRQSSCFRRDWHEAYGFFHTVPLACSCDCSFQILALFMPQTRAAFRVLALSHSALIAKYQVQLSAAEVFLATPYCPGIRAMPRCDFKQMLFFDPVLSRFNLSLGVCRVTLIFCVPTFDPPMPML